MTAAPLEKLKVYPFRRCFARFFDAFIAELLVFWGFSLWLFLSRAAARGLAILIVSCILQLLVEAACILLEVCTPGKWLFGIRIQPAVDSKVTIWRAFDRGFTAFTIGAGCYLPLIGWYAAVQSYRSLTETGTTVWDRGKFNVLHSPLRPWRFLIAGAGVTAIFAMFVLTVVVSGRI